MASALVPLVLLVALLVPTGTTGASAASPTPAAAPARQAAPFDHTYAAYAAVLRAHVRPTGVAYAPLQAQRAALDAVVQSFAGVGKADLQAWSRDEQMAFWINAYNVLTLRAIVDNYPIRAGWFTLAPRNSIRQIDGVWDRLRWDVAGQRLTLDDIEHRILRPTFREPLVHFAINCASVGCPPLASEPYRPATLAAQLSAAATRYLASAQGLAVRGDTLQVSSILKWYGDDFVERFAPRDTGPGTPTERAIRAVVAGYGPPAARALVARASPRVGFLDYDWSLNDARGTP